MTADSTTDPGHRGAVDGFLSDEQLESLLESGRASRSGAMLHTADGRRYVVEDAVRVVGCRDREVDPYALTGMVESVGSLVRRGFVVAADRIALHRVSYDVEIGVIAHPLLDAEQTGVTRRVG